MSHICCLWGRTEQELISIWMVRRGSKGVPRGSEWLSRGSEGVSTGSERMRRGSTGLQRRCRGGLKVVQHQPQAIRPFKYVKTMQVYGAQSRMRKYTSLPRRAAVDNKFSQVVGRLNDLTKQVWALSAGDSPDPVEIAIPRHVFRQ